MKSEFKTSFNRDLKKVSKRAVLDMVYDAIVAVERAATPQDIPELKKLKGSHKGNCYRIKADGYRIGITIDGDTVTFVVFKKRRDIYRFFP
ncbi:MAG: hypothetical protein LBR50_09610 [Tannerella sp.]|jgi:mRNA interferase RelE/StbE|nr:hypothetical protein [Tannerella sp.]